MGLHPYDDQALDDGYEDFEDEQEDELDDDSLLGSVGEEDEYDDSD